MRLSTWGGDVAIGQPERAGEELKGCVQGGGGMCRKGVGGVRAGEGWRGMCGLTVSSFLGEDDCIGKAQGDDIDLRVTVQKGMLIA